MPVERKIYEGYAFTENEIEKHRINYQIYKEELEPKAQQFFSDKRPTEEDLKNFVCYECIKHGYGHNVFRILSNPYNFSDDQLALICDRGNLCFGYTKEGDKIKIFAD
jgi:hypothetical protein